MSADKRNVSTDALATLGTIIEDGGRDAIHLAVDPIVAGEKIYPGDDIGIENGLAVRRGKFLGIADPFLKNPIQQGEKFWLIVYPRQITSLRHVWSHPDFEETKPLDKESNDPIEVSKRWINDFADRIRQHPKSLTSAAVLWLEEEEYTYDNSEAYKDHYDDFQEFWKHYEVVTGKAPKTAEPFFTCSC
jgi:hypothetical protein